MIAFDKQRERCLGLWETCFPTAFSLTEVDCVLRRKNEEVFQTKLQELKEKKEENTFLVLDEMFDLSWMEPSEKDKFYTLTTTFQADAKKFDSAIRDEDIFQAIRNVWIVWMLEVLFQKEITYHKAIFSYSMLYPYSDNLLDDEKLTKQEKQGFNTWFLKRLHGQTNSHELDVTKQIEQLIEEIEIIYEREHYEDVYESLYLIQKGQMLSVNQQEITDSNKLLDISIYKGGASVIADGFLIDGSLSVAEQQFCMNFGFALQLVDDIQDMVEDRQNHHYTLASTLQSKAERRTFVERVWNFLEMIMEEHITCKKEVKEFVIRNCRTIVLSSVIAQKEEFPHDFVAQIEKAMPISTTFVKGLKEQFLKETPDVVMG